MSGKELSTPHDEEIKDALIAYEAAVYEDNSDEESIEPARNALLDVLRRCRDASSARSEIEPLMLTVWEDGSYLCQSAADDQQCQQDTEWFVSIPLVAGYQAPPSAEQPNNAPRSSEGGGGTPADLEHRPYKPEVTGVNPVEGTNQSFDKPGATPRTDDFCTTLGYGINSGAFGKVVDFARQLERELAVLKAELIRREKFLQSATPDKIDTARIDYLQTLSLDEYQEKVWRHEGPIRDVIDAAMKGFQYVHHEQIEGEKK